MTDTELTRRDIVAFCEAAWARFNEQRAAQGKPADRYEITTIERSVVGGVPLYHVHFRQYYLLLGTERCLFSSYVLQQSPHTGALQFVLWDKLEEERKEESSG